jgi:hypothetical protein
MPQFLAVFLGTPQARAESGWDQLGDATRAAREREGMAAWKTWIEKHSKSITVMGSPLGKTLHVDREGVTPTRNALTAWMAIDAPSHDAAARMFEHHPHFTIFPGDAVEIVECLPMPTVE